MPKLELPHRAIAATVTAEGAGQRSRVHLVPEFKEPELTAEEKSALGLDTIEYKFLPYNDLYRPIDSRVGNWLGGVATGAEGYVRVWGVYDLRSRYVYVGGWGGAGIERDPRASRVTGTYDPRDRTSISGPTSGIVVETDPAASEVAKPAPHEEP